MAQKPHVKAGAHVGVNVERVQHKGGQGSCPLPLSAGALGGDFGPQGEQNEDWGKIDP